MERRIASGRVQLIERTDAKPIIRGHGAVFYDGTPGTQYEIWDGMIERIMPGAFDRAIKEDQDIRGLFNHDPTLLLGRTTAKTMRLSIDEKGLAYEIDPGDTTIARDVQEHLKRGDVTGSSFAFTVMTEEWRKDDGVQIREIKDVNLFDVGPVTYPAYTGSDSGVRSDGKDDDARAAYAVYRSRLVRARLCTARVIEIMAAG